MSFNPEKGKNNACRKVQQGMGIYNKILQNVQCWNFGVHVDRSLEGNWTDSYNIR